MQNLLGNLKPGNPSMILEGYPSITRGQVIAFLEEAKDRVK